jgi:hypothetical protein
MLCIFDTNRRRACLVGLPAVGRQTGNSAVQTEIVSCLIWRSELHEPVFDLRTTRLCDVNSHQPGNENGKVKLAHHRLQEGK